MAEKRNTPQAVEAGTISGGAEARDAARWRALVSSPRVRFIGGAKLGTPEALICVEFYGDYPNDEKLGEDNSYAIRHLTDYANARAALRAAAPEVAPQPGANLPPFTHWPERSAGSPAPERREPGEVEAEYRRLRARYGAEALDRDSFDVEEFRAARAALDAFVLPLLRAAPGAAPTLEETP